MKATIKLVLGMCLIVGGVGFFTTQANATVWTFTTGNLSGSSNAGELDGSGYGSLVGSLINNGPGTFSTLTGPIAQGHVGSVEFIGNWSLGGNMAVAANFGLAQPGDGGFSATFVNAITGAGSGGGPGSVGLITSNATNQGVGTSITLPAFVFTYSGDGLPTIASTGFNSYTFSFDDGQAAGVPEIPAGTAVPLLTVIGLGMMWLRKRCVVA